MERSTHILPGEALQKLPLTMKQLVEHSPGRLSDGTLYLGSRSSSVLELDLHGNIITDSSKERKKVLLVGKNNLHLNIINPDDSRRWNSTLTAIEGVKVGFSDTFKHLFSYYKYYSSFNGVLLARSRRSRRIKWVANFGYPVVALYHIVELPSNSNDPRKLYTLRPLILETKHPWIQTGGAPDLVNIGEIESVLFVLPQNKFPIIDHFENITDVSPDFAVEEGREASEMINYIDDFDPTECFPGTPNFPECLKGSKFAYKPFPVPLLEGYSAPSFRKYLIAAVIGAVCTLVILRIARRRMNSKPDSSKLKIFEDQVLGYGSHGTVVFKGEFDGRPVAVKRMLLDFYDIAGQEVSLLQHSDYHPNVIRYYYRERTEKFVNIALELCPMTLQSLIEKKQQEESEGSSLVDQKALMVNQKEFLIKDILRQIISGLEHLHNLNIVHRDIKPANILISSNERVVLSDFGVSKKLAADQMSFQATVSTGTSGWRAPEVILSDEAKSFSLKIQNGQKDHQRPNSSSTSLRVTKAIDIFSAGCVFYYIQSGGGHPFGDRLVRDSNIISGKVDLSRLGEDCDSFLLGDLILKMIDRKPERRPSARSILNHPFFWPEIRRLSFLEALSDRLERDDRNLGLTNRALEAEKQLVMGGSNVSWHTLVDKSIWDSPEYRKYFGNSLQDLIRLIRNKRHHWQELPLDAKKLLKDPTIGYLNYFDRLFPNLLAYTYRVVAGSPFTLETPFSDDYYKK